MIISMKTALYVLNTSILLSRPAPTPGLTDLPHPDWCPECGFCIEHQEAMGDSHIVFDKGPSRNLALSPPPTTHHELFVLVGCEGGWVIDPILAAVQRPAGWEPQAAPPPVN